MIRKFLAATVSVVVLSAGAAAFASPANAESFLAGEFPATVAGKSVNEFTISNGVRSFSCASSNFTGKLTSSSAELQLTPSYAECTAGEGLYVKITFEPFKLDVHFLRWTFIIPDFFIKLTGGWKVDFWLSEKLAKEEKPPLCSLEVPETGNAAIETVTGISEGSGSARHMLMEVNSSNLLVKRTAGTEANCGKEKQTAGTMSGKFDLTASKEGKEVGLWFE